MKRALVAVLSCAVAIAALGAAPAQAAAPRGEYLALGDSVAYGTDPNKNVFDAASFSGYPDIVAGSLRLAETNPSCPGEASGGFIDVAGLDNVCRFYRSHFPLHVSENGVPAHASYTGLGESQLQFAVDFLDHHPKTRLITIDLGANDLFKLGTLCAAAHPGDPDGAAACVIAQTPTYLANMKANLLHIFQTLRAHYRGTIVALTYYSLVYDAAGIAGTKALNAPMIEAADEFDVQVASGFDAFKAISLAKGGGDSCKAGLRLLNLHLGSKPPLAPTCDVHPTPAGHQLLARVIIHAVHDDEGHHD